LFRDYFFAAPLVLWLVTLSAFLLWLFYLPGLIFSVSAVSEFFFSGNGESNLLGHSNFAFE
jgi:hypothetical protein